MQMEKDVEGFKGDDQPLPRELMTPITMAGEAVGAACSVFVDRLATLLREQGHDAEDFFFEKIFREAWDDDSDDGDARVKEFILEIDHNPKEAADFAMIHAVLIAVSFAVQAMKSRKNSRKAWSYAASAKYWAGILRAAPFGYKNDREMVSAMATELGRSGAIGRDNRYQPVREKAFQLARQKAPRDGMWPSRRQAVLTIMGDVKAYAASVINGGMSEQQAQVTIDSWLKNMPNADTLFAG